MNGETNHIHGLENQVVQMSLFPFGIHGFNPVPAESPAEFLRT